MRWKLGRLFGWDDERFDPPASSYAHRVADDVRSQSLYEPGSISHIYGPFRVIYAFTHEALYEIINLTGHHFLQMSMEPAAGGYTVYWAVYVKKVSWITPVYMNLIDPFRRVLVYPAVIKSVERAWAAEYSR